MQSQSSPLSMPLAWNLVATGYSNSNFVPFEKYSHDAIQLSQLNASHGVLDVAAGPGTLSLQALGIAKQVVALDFSREMLEQLNLRAAQLPADLQKNLQVQQADGQSLPFDANSFDRVYSMFGLMFFPDREKGFAELFRVLKPGGKAVVSSWQSFADVSKFAAVFEALGEAMPDLPKGDGKMPLSDADDFQREISSAGFEVEMRSVVHRAQIEDGASFWRMFRSAMAPIALIENHVGADAFKSISEHIEKRLSERFPKAFEIEMPAWLAIGSKQ